MKMNADASRKVVVIKHSNRYQPLDVSDSEEETSVKLDKTPATSNVISSPNTSRNNNYTTNHKKNNDINIIVNEKIDEIINEF